MMPEFAMVTEADFHSWHRHEPPRLSMLAVIIFVSAIAYVSVLDAVQSLSPASSIVSVFGDDLPAALPWQTVVQRHLYVACIDTNAKQPAWIAYTVKKADWDTGNVLDRNFSAPKELRSICLEPADFAKSGYEMGHLYGLQFVSASPYAYEVNQTCAIAAQRPNLNRGPWLQAENRIKKLSEGCTVKVIAGQLFCGPIAPLANADEPHRVASHCFLIVSTTKPNTVAWLIPQSCRDDDPLECFEIPVAKLRGMIQER